MLDPREQQKGGFGAFAARERERRTAGQEPLAPADGAASGSDTVPAPHVASDVASNAAAPSRRRRFFGFLLP